MPLEPLLPAILRHFESLADRYATFDHHEFQVEGWLKGELVHLLHRDREALAIDHVDREVRVNGGRVDVAVYLRDRRTVWIELKHWRIGLQRGQRWTFANTVRDPEAFGLLKDIGKLTCEQCRGCGFAMLLLTARPDPADWQQGLADLNARLGPTARAEPMTDPATFPPGYFLGVLRVCRAS